MESNNATKDFIYIEELVRDSVVHVMSARANHMGLYRQAVDGFRQGLLPLMPRHQHNCLDTATMPSCPQSPPSSVLPTELHMQSPAGLAGPAQHLHKHLILLPQSRSSHTC